MAFNKNTNTITLGKDSDFLVDSGVFFINMLYKSAKENGASEETLSDWSVIEKWLQCEGRGITKDDEEKIAKAWKAYLAIGLAPSFKLQPAFDLFSNQCKETGYSYKEDKPSTEIMNVFDKQIATKEELEAKRKNDWSEEKNKFEKVFKNQIKKPTLKQRISGFNKNTRVLIVTSLAWVVWVIFRTSDDYELLGIYLDAWDDDMFLINAILPILAAWVAFKSYKWVSNAEK